MRALSIFVARANNSFKPNLTQTLGLGEFSVPPALRTWFAIPLLSMLAACSPTPDQRFDIAIFDLRDSVESHQPDQLHALIADTFTGQDGQDRDAAVRELQRFFDRHRNSKIAIEAIEYQRKKEGNQAVLWFNLTTAPSTGRALPATPETYGVETRWRYKNGRWQIIGANRRESSRWAKDNS